MRKKPSIRKQKQLAKVLPSGLYVNAKEGKRGQGEFVKSVNTRLTKEYYQDLMLLLDTIGVQRSAFVRYAIEALLIEVKKVIQDHEQIHKR